MAAAVIAMVLLVAGAAAVFDPEGGWLSLAGVIAACTPTAIFLAASLNPSGFSVAAGVALSASLLRIGRARAAPARVWALLGCSGAALLLSQRAWRGRRSSSSASSRSRGPSTIGGLVHEHARAASVGIGLLAVGVITALIWHAPLRTEHAGRRPGAAPRPR